MDSVQIQLQEKIDLELLAKTIERIDFTPFEELGWTAMRLKVMGCTIDGIPLKVEIYYDDEAKKVIARHE